MTNLMSDPASAAKATGLREKLFAELKKQNDPRILGQGDVFDNYLSPRSASASKENAAKSDTKEVKESKSKKAKNREKALLNK